ncbi:peptide ABC transporter, permease protein [Oceanicola granulosus HTCC2516]|uniref:Peptide ABC transporter, permease protein n=1 Tax=Oceanicola granulosus (strain ATCC BAA-861 / DSM 15982 / KCTC 12143 / HTCC2516) TaxID=314256 RepID=Q2CEF5_OCEGH|nr:ABC transporter permease [Oceanicola granulosus]EAR51042.1 peptide ABC transporter, permease protein [Oceanicola granulosus HTCC2516]
MLLFALRRLLQLVPVLIGVLVIAFAVTRLTPGDPAEIMGGFEASDETIAAIREDMGLNEPIHRQFVIYLGNILTGDLGRSYYNGREVTRIISETLPRTAALAGVALAFTLIVGIPLGVVSALRKDTWIDLGARTLALAGVSAPPFFAGLLAILVFASYLRILPSYGAGSWLHVVLPGVTLGLSSAGLVMRLTRSAMLEVLNQNYIRTARAKGLPPRMVNYRHAFRNASIPIVTITGLQLGSLLSGAVLTETVFAYPGIGRLLVRSIFERDFPVVQGLILLIAVIYLVANLLVDLFYTLVDPRISHG